MAKKKTAAQRRRAKKRLLDKAKTLKTMFTSAQLSQFRSGPRATYVPPTVPVRARRPVDPFELPAAPKALAARDRYWEEVKAIVANYQRCVANFGRQNRSWWIERFYAFQTSGTGGNDFLKDIENKKT